MKSVDEIIDNLKTTDKVSIDDGVNLWEGFVKEITEEELTIHIYVPDVYKTFKRDDIVEIWIQNS